MHIAFEWQRLEAQGGGGGWFFQASSSAGSSLFCEAVCYRAWQEEGFPGVAPLVPLGPSWPWP